MSENRLEGILRAAWKTHRLDAIRDVVQETIVELRARNPREVMGRGVSWFEELEDGPLYAALDACCDELLDGCGLPVERARNDRETRANTPAGGWTAIYSAALAQYREAASVALELSFERLLAPIEH